MIRSAVNILLPIGELPSPQPKSDVLPGLDSFLGAGPVVLNLHFALSASGTRKALQASIKQPIIWVVRFSPNPCT